MEARRYLNLMKDKDEEFEAICKRCGKCCGAGDDPCRNLAKKHDGSYFCKDYDNRLGRQKTVSGRIFNCVSIREHIAKDSLKPGCAYREIL
ncbi:MAG: hypothetical protein PVH45_02110 [Candidatus Omnitrophota bacterium]